MKRRRDIVKAALSGAVVGMALPRSAAASDAPSPAGAPAMPDATRTAFRPDATPIVRTVADELNDADVNPKRFGARGDDRSDDSVAIQTAIDEVASRGGGVVRFPAGCYRCNVVLKDGVSLISGAAMFGYLPGRARGAVVLAQARPGFVVDSPSTLIRGVGVSGINFEGLGAGYPGGGVRLQLAKWGAIRRCMANNFADQAFQHLAGFGVVFEDLLTTNVLLRRKREYISGCIEALGTDDFLNRIEANPSLIAGQGTVTRDLLLCGIVVGGANNFLSNCIGEDAERGIYVAPQRGAGHRLSLVRGDSNIGYGIYVDGSALWSACYAYNNSSAAIGEYSGFYFSDKSNSNLVSACRSEGANNRYQKYGFEDHASYTDFDDRNQYVACAGDLNRAGLFSMAPRNGSIVSHPSQVAHVRISQGVVDVSGSSFVVLEGGARPSRIVDFAGAAEGQTILVLSDDSVSVAGDGAIMSRNSARGTDWTLEPNTVHSFTKYRDRWYPH